MIFLFPSVICTRCTGFFCLAIIKGPPNDIYCIIEEPYKHYFTEKVSHTLYISFYFGLIILVFSVQRKSNCHNSSLFCTFFCLHFATVNISNFPNQMKVQDPHRHFLCYGIYPHGRTAEKYFFILSGIPQPVSATLTTRSSPS